MIKIIDGGVCAAKGFSAGGIHAGIKADPDKKDLAIICCEKKCSAAALFTTNKIKAAPILLSKKHLIYNEAQAIVVNSGNANACTANGIQIADKMCELTANALGIDKQDVIVASTGVIGQVLKTTPFESGIPELADDLSGSERGSAEAAQAIMTTDTFPKQHAVEFELDGVKCRIGGIAKGSGMINPNMATMLVFITTDVSISYELLEKALRGINSKTFNMVSVDGDTSTNDMVSIMASGLSGNQEIIYDNDVCYLKFREALDNVMRTLAQYIARDGEGATKLIECKVKGAPDKQIAGAVAKSVISSSLVKAALGAADANWGRILCAIGYVGFDFDISKVKIEIASSRGRLMVCKSSTGVSFSEKKATDILSEEEIGIYINLYLGNTSATAWGCDLTQEYVKINADYRS
jgi:glutamate N-acetyltransferase/amino-acid N-acetyltransferase